MGAMRGLLVLTLMAVVSGVANAAGRVFVVAPNVLNVNENEGVSVLVTDIPQARASVTLTLSTTRNKRQHSTVTANVAKDKQELVHLKVDGSKLGAPEDSGLYYVQLRVQCASANFDRTTDILVNKRTGTVFLQTDKPVYSPGERVSARIFSLDEKRRATDLPIRVEIKNPQGIITERKDERTATGIYIFLHELSDRPLLGTWTIVVYFGQGFNESREKEIEVKKYVLPHFHVKLNMLQNFIDNTTTHIEGSFEARYSFNAAVVGSARVVFRIVRDGEAQFATDKKASINNGRGTFKLSMVELLQGEQLPQLIAAEAKLQVEVFVTETSTGIRESIIGRACPFVTSPYVITFEGTQRNFMPGLPFEIQANVRHVNGVPVGNSELSITAKDQSNKEVERTKTAGQTFTNDKGILWYSFDVRGDITSITVEVKVIGDDQSKTEYVATKATMPSYMQISSHTTRILTPGTSTQFRVVLTESKNLNLLYYMLVSSGRILDAGKVTQPGSTVISLSRPIKYDMVPSVRILAWYFRKDNKHLVATSNRIEVDRRCKTEAQVGRVHGAQGKMEPGDLCSLSFRGTAGATLATMAIDKSVYFMNGTNKLTRKSFFDEFLSRDLGCGAGGGANATDVFNLAGMTVIGNSDLIQRRASLECANTQAPTRRRRSTGNEGPSEETCCNAGELYANTTEIGPSRSVRIRSCFTAAKNFNTGAGRACKNMFGKCCIKRAVEKSSHGNTHSRSHNNEENFEEDFVTDEADTRERVDFPESWMIRSDLKIPNSGELQQDVTLPGTITTWVFEAATMSKTEGMCVAKPFEQVANKDLFLKLHLPHTAVQGEQIELAATVYNLGRSRRARVSLLGVDGACSDAAEGEYSSQRHTIPAYGSWTARWPFIPMKRGDLEITVKLYSSSVPDIVRRTLTVVPSGDLVVNPILNIPQDPSGRSSNQRRWSEAVGSLRYSAVKDTTKQEQVSTVTLREPNDALSGTSRLTLTMLGDVMTPIVESQVQGTEKFLHRASGCGEQTMAGLAPAVFSANYLRHVGKLTGKLEADAKNKVKRGYGHMLKYRKDNGGFAVWAHHQPRIWLTASALKTFSLVRNFTTVDNKVLENGFTWLMSQNSADGMYDKLGLPHHHDMTGGVSERSSLTAYVYIALLESGYYNRHQAELDRALDRLVQKALTENNAYTLAIVSYALAKRGHRDAVTINRRLLNRARSLPNKQPPQMYWPRNLQNPSPTPSHLEVETTAYALLAQVALRRINQSNPIVEWLVRQRYGGHYFGSTQSTVITLQALTEYSILAVKDNLAMTCTLSSPGEPAVPSIQMTNDNRLVQQRREITHLLGKVLMVSCSGVGVANAVIESTYYSSKTAAESCAFNITAQAIPSTTAGSDDMTIKVCARLTDPQLKLAMPMMEVGIGTGYLPLLKSPDSVKTTVANTVDFYEVNDRSVVFYMSEIPSSKSVCLDFQVSKKEVDVKNVRPVPVKVYAYYEPDKYNCRKFYDPRGGSESATLDVQCDRKAGFCKCREHQCPKCYGHASLSKDYRQPLQTVQELMHFACAPTSSIDYVFAGTVEYSVVRAGETNFYVKIDTVAKEGTERTGDLLHNTRVFVMPVKCLACHFDTDRRYIFMGQDGLQTKDGVMEYQISTTTYIMPLWPRQEARQVLNAAERKVNGRHKSFLRNLLRDSCGL